ncbi:MAG: hypothetical protein M1337_08650, partial [Actinobacteria bacterium]|nr:hypothetical protein [Actinomycetota bacterium]
AALTLAAFSVYVIYFRIIRSDFGLGLTALRDAEGFAVSLGVNEHRTKLTVFAASAFFTGLAGAFYVHYTGSVSQKLLGMDLFLLIMVMLIVGGWAGIQVPSWGHSCSPWATSCCGCRGASV